MKVGNLVKYKNLHGHVVGGKFISKEWTGIILEELTNVFKILWSTGTLSEEARSSLELVICDHVHEDNNIQPSKDTELINEMS